VCRAAGPRACRAITGGPAAEKHSTNWHIRHPAGENQGGNAIDTTARKPEGARTLETCLAELLDHLGVARAHFAGRGSADLQGFASRHPERIASITLLCPAVLDTATLALLAERLLIVTGDHGPGPRRVQAGLAELPQASVVVLITPVTPGPTSPPSGATASIRRCSNF
jgi:pimeloyl-ACP methyl ester carboxylesterase